MARDDMRSRVKKLIGIASLMLAFLLIFSTGVSAETQKEYMVKKCDALLEDIDKCNRSSKDREEAGKKMGIEVDYSYFTKKKHEVEELKKKIESTNDDRELTDLIEEFGKLREIIPVRPEDLAGETPDSADEWLKVRGLKPDQQEERIAENNNEVPKGRITRTYTVGFELISYFNDESQGGTVTYYVSQGPQSNESKETESPSPEDAPSAKPTSPEGTTNEAKTKSGKGEGNENPNALTTEGKTDGTTANPFSGNGSDNVNGNTGDEKSWISQNWILLLIIGILAIALIIAIVFILTSGKKKKRKQLSEIRKGYTANQTNYPGQRSSMGAAYQQPNRLPEEDKDEKTLLLSNVQSRGINAHLISVRTGVDFPLKITARTVVGSGADCDCTINDPAFALRQFMLEWNGEDVYIDDLNTATGTRMNGTPLRHKRRMESEDRIGVGESEYIIRW